MSPDVQARRRFGAVDVPRHRVLAAEGVHLHVFYRGIDVTTRCAFADDTGEGMAELYLLNADGKKYLVPVVGAAYGEYPGEREVAKEIVYGVTIVEGEPFT